MGFVPKIAKTPEPVGVEKHEILASEINRLLVMSKYMTADAPKELQFVLFEWTELDEVAIIAADGPAFAHYQFLKGTSFVKAFTNILKKTGRLTLTSDPLNKIRPFKKNKDGKATVSVEITENRLLLHQNGIAMVCELSTEAKYPEYRQFVPQKLELTGEKNVAYDLSRLAQLYSATGICASKIRYGTIPDNPPLMLIAANMEYRGTFGMLMPIAIIGPEGAEATGQGDT